MLLQALSLVVLMASGCVPPVDKPETPTAPAAPLPAPEPSPGGMNGARGTDDAQGARGTDDAVGERGLDGTEGRREATPIVPPLVAPTPGMQPAMPGTAQAPAVDAASDDAVALADLHQIHLHEIALAGLAAEKSTDPGLRSYAEQEARDHTRADANLVQLATSKGISWGQADPARYTDQTATIERLRGLEGAAFDKAYLQETLQDHERGYSLVETSLTTLQDPATKAEFARLQPILRAHRDRARQLRPGEQGS